MLSSESRTGLWYGSGIILSISAFLHLGDAALSQSQEKDELESEVKRKPSLRSNEKICPIKSPSILVIDLNVYKSRLHPLKNIQFHTPP